MIATGGPDRDDLLAGAFGARRAAPAAVGAYIGAAYWFTSSTSFANPAITVGRVFSDTFAGIAPASVAPFILAQLAGGAVAFALVSFLYPRDEANSAAASASPASVHSSAVKPTAAA